MPPPFLLFLQRPLVSFRARREPSQASSKSPALHCTGFPARQRQPLLNLPDPVDTRRTEGRPRCSGRLLAPSAELAVRCAAAALATRGAALEHGHDLTARHACSFPASPARPLSPLVPVASHVPFVYFHKAMNSPSWHPHASKPERTPDPCPNSEILQRAGGSAQSMRPPPGRLSA